jgi:hypothetical protein
VWRKSLSCEFIRVRLVSAATFLAVASAAVGAEPPVLLNDSPKFLGAASCASSGCHGGGGPEQNQSLVWSLKDFHSQRPFATLTTARSKQIADALKIKDPTADSRCTSCHAPLALVPDARRGEGFKVSEGVSCESCHGPAENWVRAHTRHDWTHADRTFAGARDLKNLYVRANTCVACHQTVEVPLLNAGHPELIFELDGQSVTQPKHWREDTRWSGAQSWLVGQAVALRELSWQVSREPVPGEKLTARWSALLWLLQQLDGLNPQFPALSGLSSNPEKANVLSTLKAADDLAQRAAEAPWTDKMSRSALSALAATAATFRQDQTPVPLQARRAERLVLGLDRLLAQHPQTSPATSAKINELFKRAQSITDFDPAGFAGVLDDFAQGIEADQRRPDPQHMRLDR